MPITSLGLLSPPKKSPYPSYNRSIIPTKNISKQPQKGKTLPKHVSKGYVTTKHLSGGGLTQAKYQAIS